MRDAADNLTSIRAGAAFVGLIFAAVVQASPQPDSSRTTNFWFVPAWRLADRVEWDRRYGPTIARLAVPLGALILVVGVALRLAS